MMLKQKEESNGDKEALLDVLAKDLHKDPVKLRTVSNTKALADALEWHLAHNYSEISIDFIHCVKRAIYEMRKNQ